MCNRVVYSYSMNLIFLLVAFSLRKKSKKKKKRNLAAKQACAYFFKKVFFSTVLKYVQLNWMYNWFKYERISLTSLPLFVSLPFPSLPVEVTAFFPSFSHLLPVTLNEAPWVALVWPDSCARGSLSKSSSKQRIRQRWGAAAAAARVQPCRAGPCCALGAVVLFTVRLVPQDAVHLVCDGRWQLWKNLRQERDRWWTCSHIFCLWFRSTENISCSYTSQPLESAEGWVYSPVSSSLFTNSDQRTGRVIRQFYSWSAVEFICI